MVIYGKDVSRCDHEIYSKEDIDKKINDAKRSVAYASMQKDSSNAPTPGPITFDNIEIVGEHFSKSLEKDKIIIGENVSKILISFFAEENTKVDESTFAILISKNGNNIETIWCDSNNSKQISLSPALFTVAENDKIGFGFSSTAETNKLGTLNVTVQEVG